MTAQDVINAAPSESHNWYDGIYQIFTSPILWMLVAIIIISIYLLKKFKQWDENEEHPLLMLIVSWEHIPIVVGFVAIASTLMVVMVVYLSLTQGPESVQQQRITDWSNEYVQPYINTLPVEQNEVISIQEVSDEDGNTQLEVQFTEGVEPTLFTHKVDIYVYPKTQTKQKPYVTYRVLEEDLGYNYLKGVINTKLHIPEGLDFSEPYNNKAD